MSLTDSARRAGGAPQAARPPPANLHTTALQLRHFARELWSFAYVAWAARGSASQRSSPARLVQLNYRPPPVPICRASADEIPRSRIQPADARQLGALHDSLSFYQDSHAVRASLRFESDLPPTAAALASDAPPRVAADGDAHLPAEPLFEGSIKLRPYTPVESFYQDRMPTYLDAHARYGATQARLYDPSVTVLASGLVVPDRPKDAPLRFQGGRYRHHFIGQRNAFANR